MDWLPYSLLYRTPAWKLYYAGGPWAMSRGRFRAFRIGAALRGR